jgi:hypothetical protein
MVEITLPIVLQLLQTAGILVGIVYYITIMRNQQKNQELALKGQEEAEKTRQRELIFQRFQTFDLDFTKAWADVMFMDVSTPEQWLEAYDPKVNPETWANMSFLGNRYNNLGIMLKEKIIDPEMLFKIFNPTSIMTAWEHYKRSIMARREHRNQPDLFESFEFLADEARRRYPDITPSRAQWGSEWSKNQAAPILCARLLDFFPIRLQIWA